MMVLIRTFFLLSLLLLLSGCAGTAPSPIVGVPRRRTLENSQAHPITETETLPIPYTVLFTQAGATLTQHEPVEGAYLGAWLSPDISSITLRSFGNLAEKPHAVFVYEMQPDDEIPMTWILHAMAANAIPLFYLRPHQADSENRLPVVELVNLARGLGVYNTPMFLAFYPLEPGHGKTADEYITVYRLARILFRTYAPQVAFVWIPPEGKADATPAHPFYPGHDMVDWVGLPAMALRGRGGLNADILEVITPFHQVFQRHKPIMLLPVGISHFSRIDYTYYIEEAAAEMKRLYAGLSGFPRVKAVVYRDASHIGPRWDDMTLTREYDLMAAYANAVACEHFISEHQPQPARIRQWLRSAFNGYFYGGDLFVDAETLVTELYLPQPGSLTELNGRNFVDIHNLMLDIHVNHERRIIYINLPS
jgi:hypothetical protein